MNKQTLSIKMDNTGDFASFGTSVMAYIKKIDLDGQPVFMLCGADGATLGVEQTEVAAMVYARMKNLYPVAVQ